MNIFALLVCIVAIGGCFKRSHVSDEHLLRLFEAHRAEFDALAREAASGSERAIVDAEFQKRLEALGVRDVQVNGSAGDAIVSFAMSSYGLATHGSEKGILRSKRDLQPVVESLNGRPEGSGEKYRRIGDEWYLYLEWW